MEEEMVQVQRIEPEFTEALEEISGLYKDARNLIDEQSKLDPITAPHVALWAGIQILHNMIQQLNQLLDDANAKYILPKIAPKIKAILGGLWCEVATVCLELEEPAVDKQFQNSLEYLENDPLNPEHVIPLITSLNSLGLIYSQRDMQANSKGYLENAEQIYNNFIKIKKNPIDIKTLFSLSSMITADEAKEASATLEGLHTLTLYYLAQVYGRLDNHVKSAVYCHSTLKRQLHSSTFDPIDWALNSATLSQYFTEKNRFPEAKHHLCASSYILDQYEAELGLVDLPTSLEEEHLAKLETLRHRKADVARCWCKYGILLLIASKDRLMTDNVQDRFENLDATLGEQSELWFTTLDLARYEGDITSLYLLTYEDAREVFLTAQNWIYKARAYYTLEELASDHVELIRDHSELFKSLSFFEENEDRQCKMHKRRIALLEPILLELNAQYYSNICRQLWFELGETYSEILGIKIDKMQSSDDRPTPRMLKKINNLAEESISNFRKFLDSLQDSGTKKMPMKFSDELVRPALMAQFYIGSLNRKIIVTDKRLQIEYARRSLEAYNFMVDYCDRNELAAGQMTLELAVVREMVALLPHKIDKLLRESS